MERIGKVSVFRAYKPILHIVTIFDMKNFRIANNRILIRNICQAIAISMMVLALIVAILCDIWYCMDNNFNVPEIALPFGVLINLAQLAITYISIRMKSGLVDEVISRLEKEITKRKYSVGHINQLSSIDACIRFYTQYLIFIGCELASKRTAHYERLEDRFAFFISTMFKVAIVDSFLFFGVAFFVPISYAIFGYPEPDHWARVYEFR